MCGHIKTEKLVGGWTGASVCLVNELAEFDCQNGSEDEPQYTAQHDD
jgi:hypothetical protein